MTSIEQIFSDKKGNHLLVALYLCDNDYKLKALNIPEEYTDIEIVDINIGKASIEKPIHPVALFKMTSWLLEQFKAHPNTIFTFICSTDGLSTNHPDDLPQTYRWNLFDKLHQRIAKTTHLNVQDVKVGPEGYQSYGRAFYRDEHAPIIHIISSHLKEKQQ